MSTDNLVGRTVAGYHLAKYIGEGGTATVYRAERADRGESAVKILRPRLASDPIAVSRPDPPLKKTKPPRDKTGRSKMSKISGS